MDGSAEVEAGTVEVVVSNIEVVVLQRLRLVPIPTVDGALL